VGGVARVLSARGGRSRGGSRRDRPVSPAAAREIPRCDHGAVRPRGWQRA
jgi:hypothetical protein